MRSGRFKGWGFIDRIEKKNKDKRKRGAHGLWCVWGAKL